MGMTLEDLMALNAEEDSKTASKKAEFSIEGGGDNFAYYEGVFDRDGLITNMGQRILSSLISAGNLYGVGKYTMTNIYDAGWSPQGALGLIDEMLRKAQADYDSLGNSLPPYLVEDIRASQGQTTVGMGGAYYNTARGFEEMYQTVMGWFNQQVPFDLNVEMPRGGRGRGGGSRRPTEEEIRNQFDIDALARAATNLWRSNLLEEPDDARKLARSYVDAVVATGAEKQIDFEEFIRGKIEATDRFASIYRSKPESMAPEQYLSPYFNAALGVLRPDNADEVAIGGAQFGADAATFSARLQRSDEFTGSSNFVNQLEGRMRTVNQVFRG